MLRFSDIGFGHSEGGVYQKIIENFSADFPRGSMTALTGPSGCGKTTLLSMGSLLVRPDSGSITLAGTDLLQLDKLEREVFRRKSIALVFQTSRLIKTCSVREHLLMTEKIRGIRCVDTGFKLLERFNLSGKLNQKPSSLSGGEKQRVALAQALMFDPEIVLADEPTAALDEASTGIVAEALRQYARDANAPVIVVTHDNKIMDVADRIIHLEHGTIKQGI